MKKEYHNTYWPFKIDGVCSYAYLEDFLTPQECDEIISVGINNGLQDGLLAEIEKSPKGKKNKKVRDSKITWLFPDKNTDWLYRRLTDAITSLNNQFFNFDLYGFAEGLQFTHYKAPAGHYGKHIDRTLNMVNRKLSLVIQLSDESKYKGGELCLYEQDKPYIYSKKQGTLCLFPSYVLHEVTPVTNGERYSLVAWITGPNFK
jgi:PKHD-type hydroxylase